MMYDSSDFLWSFIVICITFWNGCILNFSRYKKFLNMHTLDIDISNDFRLDFLWKSFVFSIKK